jgi:eukaryotic-like serine/threonine-protein kinase
MDEGAQIGAYRVLEQIGEGGMGAVWLAEHIALGRRAALTSHRGTSTRTAYRSRDNRGATAPAARRES